MMKKSKRSWEQEKKTTFNMQMHVGGKATVYGKTTSIQNKRQNLIEHLPNQKLLLIIYKKIKK